MIMSSRNIYWLPAKIVIDRAYRMCGRGLIIADYRFREQLHRAPIMAALLRLARLRESLLARVVLKRPPLSVVSSTRPATALYSSNGGDGGSKISEDDLLPQYIPREGESETAKRARLLYQSR